MMTQLAAWLKTSKLSVGTVCIVTFLVIALSVLLFSKHLIVPSITSNSDIKQQIQALDHALAALDTKINKNNDSPVSSNITTTVKSPHERYSKGNSEIFLQTLLNNAKSHKLRVDQMQVTESAPLNEVSTKYSYLVLIKGSYFDIGEFLFSLEETDTYTVFDTIEIAIDNDTGLKNLTMRVSIITLNDT